MLIGQFISQKIRPVASMDSKETMLKQMESCQSIGLPLIDKEGKFLRFVLKVELLNDDSFMVDKTNFKPSKEQPEVVLAQTHFWDILKLIGQSSFEFLAIVDENDAYLGTVLVKDMLLIVAQTFSMQLPGTVLELSVDPKHYSLSDISRHIEEHKAKILQSTIHEDYQNPHRLFVTIKIDQPEVSRIVATLERFDYIVSGCYQTDKVSSDDKERLDSLLKYLEL